MSAWSFEWFLTHGGCTDPAVWRLGVVEGLIVLQIYEMLLEILTFRFQYTAFIAGGFNRGLEFLQDILPGHCVVDQFLVRLVHRFQKFQAIFQGAIL
jgi:hypothetical protein